MQPAVQLKRRITSGDLTLGILITDHLWPELIELAQAAGMHYAIVDQEHGPHSDADVARACQVARLAEFPLLVRCPSVDSDRVRRAMDMGPCGLMFPRIESTEQLDQIRDSIWMPPRGKRRPGGPGNAWPSDVQAATWRVEVEDHFIILPQIESRAGLENVESIVRHEIVTSLAVGPYDLSADLGCCWDPAAAVYRNAIATLRAAAAAAAKPFWMIGAPDELVAAGFRFVCVGEPTHLLASVMAATAERLQKTVHESKH